MLQPVGLNNRLWGCQGILGCALAKVLQPPCQAGPPHAVPSPWAWRQGAGQHRPGCKGKKRKKEKSKLQKNPISFPLLLAGLVAAPSLHCRAEQVDTCSPSVSCSCTIPQACLLGHFF